MGTQSPLSGNAGRRRETQRALLAAWLQRRKPSTARVTSALIACSKSSGSCTCDACLPAWSEMHLYRDCCKGGTPCLLSPARKPHFRCHAVGISSEHNLRLIHLLGRASEAFVWGLLQEERAGHPHDAPAHGAAAQLHAAVQ